MSEKKGEYKRAFKALEQSLSNILDQVISKVEIHIDFLSDYYTGLLLQVGQVPGNSDVAVDQVWSDLYKISDKLCFEANKLSLAWVSPPQPPVSDMVAMGGSLESVAVTLMAASAAFPLAAGTLVRDQLIVAV